MHHFGIEGTVAVQARQTLEETAWLLELARPAPIDPRRGRLGSADGRGRRQAPSGTLRRQSQIARRPPRRPGRADPRYILRADFNQGVRALRDFQLRYDILIFEQHLPAAIEFVDRHPNQIFILDHIAKPRIKDGILKPWDANIRELAKRQNVYCKLSGMVTEADPKRWTPATCNPISTSCCKAFGPKRLMYGSDWPVMLLAGDYVRWYDVVTNSDRETLQTRTGSHHGRYCGRSLRFSVGPPSDCASPSEEMHHKRDQGDEKSR